MKVRIRAALVAVIASTLALLPTSGAAAAGTIPMPLWPASMAADDHGHVYLTGGHGGLNVYDRAGVLLSTYVPTQLVRSVTLSADGSELVAVSATATGEELVVVDTSSATVLRTIALPLGPCVADLVDVAGRLWFSTWDCNPATPPSGQLSTVASTGGAVTLAGPALAQSQVRAYPGHPDRLVVLAGGVLHTFDVSGADLVERGSVALPANPSLIVPDPDGVGLDLGFSGALQEWDLDTLAVSRSYDALPVPIAVATAPGSGGIMVLSPSNGATQVYRGGTFVRAFTTIAISSYPPYVLSPDGTVLLAWDDFGNRVDILEGFTRTPSALTAAGPASVLRTHALTVAGHLTSGGVAVAGARVYVTRTDSVGARSIGYAVTDATGAWHLADKPFRQGYATYTAIFLGDQLRAPVTTKSRPVRVIGTTPVLTVTTSATTYAYGSRVAVRIHLGPTATNRYVSLTVTPYGKAASTLGPYRVNSAGDVVVTVTVRQRTTLTARFAGDVIYNPRAVAKTLLSTTRMYLVVQSAYTKVGSVYRVKAPAIALFLVLYPLRATCDTWDIQRRRGTSWVTESSKRICSTNIGNAVNVYDLVAGQTYRVRARFAGDVLSLAGSTSWLTFAVVR